MFQALRRLLSGRYDTVTDLGTLVRGQRVELVGVADPVEDLRDPVSGDQVVAIRYSATIPNAASRIGAGLLGDTLDAGMQASHAVDFVLQHPTGRALIQVRNEGPSPQVLHDHLLTTYGLELRADVVLVRPGALLRIRGMVDQVLAGSPHRGVDYTVSIRADGFSPED